MPHVLYVGLQDDDKIAVYAIDPDSGALTKRAETTGSGGPSVMAQSLGVSGFLCKAEPDFIV